MTARAAVHRLLAVEAAAGHVAPDAPAVAQRLVRRLSDELAGWFGPQGAHALLTRALVSARAEHPALAAVHVGVAPAPDLDGLADSARVHGADAVVVATGGVLVALVELLGRLIGDELATTLAEQSTRRPNLPTGMEPGASGGGTREGRAARDGSVPFGDTTGSTGHD